MSDKEEPYEENDGQDNGAEGRRDQKDWAAQNAPLLHGIAIGLGVAFVVAAVFSMGLFIGQQKARFSIRWGQNYNQNFGGPRQMLPGGPKDFFGGHGTAGVVIDVKKESLVVRSRDNAEKVVLISDETSIVKGREVVELKDIEEESAIVVIGRPDDEGRIEAHLIRLFDGTGPGGRPMQGGFLWRNDTSRQLL